MPSTTPDFRECRHGGFARRGIVWCVDDLPRNLAKFKKNHGEHFSIETFSDPEAVLRRIHQGDHPDALLCDIFFYESVAEAERVEERIEELARVLMPHRHSQSADQWLSTESRGQIPT
jgi:hypothetical protein